MAVEATSVPVPHFLNSFRNFDNLPFLNLRSRYTAPAPRASRNVMYAPRTDPAVADAAYSYQRGLWLAARIAVRMSGPAKVGMGELSIIARAKSPAAPRWRSVDRRV